MEFRDPQEVTARWVLSPLSWRPGALETLELGLGGGPVDPFAWLAREQGKRSSSQRFCLPPPQWSSGCGGGCVPRQGSGGG